MAGMFSFHTREAVRVKVKKCEGQFPTEYRKFSVDPQITSFEVMQSLLARAFDVKGEFTISYLAYDDTGQEIYFSLLSDWDLDAAFLAASQPCLRLKVDVKPFDESLEEWDIIAPVDFPLRPSQNVTLKDKAAFAGGLLNKMGEKTLNFVQKALSLVESQALLQQQHIKPLKSPMSDAEFHIHLDSDGRLIRPSELRLSIYKGGLEPGLRKVVWKHILNVYPEGLSGAERVAYMKRLSKEYYRIRDIWQAAAPMVGASEEMQTVINLVRKDVLRTDRGHKFYAGLDDNKNVVSLFSILTTYALNHPSVSYCQGMSDLASPLLVTMRDEGHAYVCFCALMKRLKVNFMFNGRAMTLKFQHLSEMLQIYDPEFFQYLRSLGADDLLFCYRWLLLELKREFAFDDALRMLEVLWSSMPHNAPEAELELKELEFQPPKPRPPTTLVPQISLPSTSAPATPTVKLRNKGENPYTKVRAMRRQSSGSSCTSLNNIVCNEKPDRARSGQHQHPPAPTKQTSFQEGDTPNEVLPDYLPMSTAVSRELRMEMDVLDQQLRGGGDKGDWGPSENREGISCSMKESESHELGCTSSSSSSSSSSSGGSSITAVSDSEELSSGEQITRVACLKKTRKKRLNQLDKQLIDNNSDEDDETFQVNGEILENDDDEDIVFDASAPEVLQRIRNPHLKNVAPIRVVREKHERRRSNGSSPPTSGENSDDEHGRPKTTVSEGYITSDDVPCCNSSLEGTQSSLLDSGVVAEVPREKETRQQERLTTATSHPMTSSCEEVTEYSSPFVASSKSPLLPSPTLLGGGNPFMIFLCLTILLQHRDYVMKNKMDYNETAMHFDKMVRKHNVNQVLHQARLLFAEYMKGKHWIEDDEDDDDEMSGDGGPNCYSTFNASFDNSNVA